MQAGPRGRPPVLAHQLQQLWLDLYGTTVRSAPHFDRGPKVTGSFAARNGRTTILHQSIADPCAFGPFPSKRTAEYIATRAIAFRPQGSSLIGAGGMVLDDKDDYQINEFGVTDLHRSDS